MKKYFILNYHVLLFFSFLGVLFIPFSFRNSNFQQKTTRFLFEDSILYINSLFKNTLILNKEISSDATTLYLLCVVLLITAVFFIFILSFFSFWKSHKEFVFKIIKLILTYYLSLILLRYGFDKIFKVQFYLPEPNILFTPLGMLEKDILFWSTMGTSYAYNLFMGMIEIIPAIMLLYKKTRVLGLFIVFGVLSNIVAVNFSFDISVKLFSSFLLFVTFLLILPYLKKIFHFFILNKSTQLSDITVSNLIISKAIRFSLKGFIILFFFTESVLPYIQSVNYNDDTAPRNHLHGAYDVLEQKNKYKENTSIHIKRFFIHRHNYFIFQYEDDTMEDFHLKINPSLNQLLLTNYKGETITLEYSYSKTFKSLDIKSTSLGWSLKSKVIHWKKLPLLQPIFHWTVDGV